MFWGVEYCYGCDRPATIDTLKEEEWINVDGHLFCPQCQEEMEKCWLCDEPNWLDIEWPKDDEGNTICPDCEEALRAKRKEIK